MAKFFDQIEPALIAFIGRQHIFFTATASAGTRINLSPKGADCLRVLDANQVVYLDQTGSGNETAAHVRNDGRLTIMFCAFEGAPMILRLYGKGRVIPRASSEYATLLETRYASAEPLGARQMIGLTVESVQTSCGYAVPLMDYQEDRKVLEAWAERKGPDGIQAYWQEKNLATIDGLPTGMDQDLSIAAE